MKLPGPVRLEVYPNHDDFIVRTLGLPGQGGLLGVTFGLVVAMDSPSAALRTVQLGDHHLARIEPRVCGDCNASSGAAMVYRGSCRSRGIRDQSALGRPPDARYRQCLAAKATAACEDLERGFVRPRYPTQVMVSYFQAGKMCDYIAERWGDDALLGMVHSFGRPERPRSRPFRRISVSRPEQFDKDFSAWLDKLTRQSVEHFDEWKKQMESAHAQLTPARRQEAIKQGTSASDPVSRLCAGWQRLRSTGEGASGAGGYRCCCRGAQKSIAIAAAGMLPRSSNWPIWNRNSGSRRRP